MDVTGGQPPSVANAFAAQMACGEAFALGQLTLCLEETGLAVIAGPGTGDDQVLATPDALRERVRHDERGRYRPLSGAKSMPGGWFARVAPNGLPDALEALYPLALVHIAAAECGELRIVPLDQVLERQAGRYRAAAQLDADGRDVASEVLCRGCVRVPVWRGVPAAAVLSIPCPEPCSVLVSLCREAALWQQSLPAPTAASPDIAFAAFETPGNEVREAYLAARQ